ncbi:MAG: TetR family transcriptional regulator [Parvularculaceae bacterium]
MTASTKKPRPNQKLRTRKALLEAAATLAATGRSPSLEEVAEAAMVSRATAYRYFPGVEELLVEAALDVSAPDETAVFDGCDARDPVARVERVDAAFEKMIAENEAGLRLMLGHSLAQTAGETPRRQNRRTPMIDAALAPAKAEFTPGNLKTLTRALGLVIGTESMIAFRDVLQLSEADAAKTRRWMIRALVEAARRPS